MTKTFRIINTRDSIAGPFGIPYIHDAARPFAVLFTAPRGETCCGRYSNEADAKRAVARFTEARARYAARQAA